MGTRIPLYDASYRNFDVTVQERVRREAFGEDIGQNSWSTTDEYRRFFTWLDLTSSAHVLDVASGSGGPALFLARTVGCFVTGIDVNENGVNNAIRLAGEQGLSSRATFQCADASMKLPFEDERFDAVICIDAINHLRNRPHVLTEWRRTMKSGGRLLFTDPIVVTGVLDSNEIAARSSIGYFVFTPLGENDRLLRTSGLDLVRVEDLTQSVARVARLRHEARERHRDELLTLEGSAPFEGQQMFLGVAERLAAQQRLSRFAFLARKV